MICLNDYLYKGDTVLKILHSYSQDLRESALLERNPIDLLHANFLTEATELLEHNEFLTSQAARIRKFYHYMVKEFPNLAFTFKGRIKSLIRYEEKFNGNIVEFIHAYYLKYGKYPSEAEIKNELKYLRDFIAYRIVISVPSCQLKKDQDKRETEIAYLYDIANRLPYFLEAGGFSAEVTRIDEEEKSPNLTPEVRPYYKDYIYSPKEIGYESLHIIFFDSVSRCYVEVQLRTKEMDDFAEIGPANHLGYEKHQEIERARRDAVPEGKCLYFDQAYERGMRLQMLELNKVDVNMFAAVDNHLINDGCGLYRGRQITPFEHLSRFQSE